MTQKELLYFKDAIEHEKNIISICEESINLLEDEDLISFFEEEIKKHIKTKDDLINLMEGLVNE